ncbi:hypothetical protein QBC37DRAFT_356693 [Rhypophila decipiens]|uniref:RelA/SpoT domain-containing protein n=1 Tax=Rhypophila decipiens TaxID=261697 RepID=A0AAN6XW00_9PEZI|nr:hypothetical protein QBC37DRAFT_356693 [Rhypophila decipiens]
MDLRSPVRAQVGDGHAPNQLLRAKINQMTQEDVGTDPKSTFVNDIWPKLQNEYDTMKEGLEEFCKDALKRKDIYCEVKSRTKEVGSIKKSLDRREKALREQKQQRFESLSDIFRKIHDLVGLRIILQFADDMERATCFIKESFRMEEEPVIFLPDREVGRYWKPWFGAYQTRNYRVSLKDGQCVVLSRFCDVMFEIQVTTISEDLYNKLAHPLLYKDNGLSLTRHDEIVVDLAHGSARCYALSLAFLEDKLKKCTSGIGGRDEVEAATKDITEDVIRFRESWAKTTSFDAPVSPRGLLGGLPPEGYNSVDDLKGWIANEITAVLDQIRSSSQTIPDAVLSKLAVAVDASSPRSVLEEKKVEWLERLYSCPYADRKDVNPPRVEGTCEWFTGHQLFRNWQQSNTASLLWVSADPGCGKSVLAKYLVDDVLPSTDTRTTCYFFFKDGFDDQKSSTIALCCILRQIFKQRPGCFSDQILKKLEEDKKVEKGETKPPTSFRDLWDLFMAAAIGHKTGEIVCIIDALDECEDSGRNQLIDAISSFHCHTTTRTPVLKFLLTSRPYQGIARKFSQHLERELPTIHLSGESAEEAGKISREIDLVVRNRIVDDGRRLGLTQEQQNVLREELTRVPNHTYLWVYLIFDIINRSIIDRAEDIRSIANTIPKTVDAAYDRILSKSPDIERARKILHIIVAAARPLTLQEMDLALAIVPKHRSFSDLEPVPETRFRENIRQHCGLFVVVVDSKIYLLHQTAREFLVPSLSPGRPVFPSSGPKLQWKFSLYPGESNRILAEICMRRLSLWDFSLKSLQTSQERDKYIAKRTLLGYSAQYWAEHFRKGDWNSGDWTIEKATKTALSHLNPQKPASLAWFEIYQMLETKSRPPNFIPLIIASYFGHNTVVQQLLEAGAEVDAKDNDGRTPLHWASEQDHSTVVQQLLEAGAEVDAKDNDGRTPLHWASAKGHGTVVQQLLEAGAEVDAKKNDGWTPLHWASLEGHSTVVQQLLEASAEVDAKNSDGWTPLHCASEQDHSTVVQQLLEAGAEVDAKDNDGRTPLHCASEQDDSTVVQQLLEAGAEVDAKDNDGETPLHWASEKGHDNVV